MLAIFVHRKVYLENLRALTYTIQDENFLQSIILLKHHVNLTSRSFRSVSLDLRQSLLNKTFTFKDCHC